MSIWNVRVIGSCCCWLVIVIVISGSRAEIAPDDNAQIGFNQSKTGLIFISLKFKDDKRTFLVDTGAANTYIDKSWMRDVAKEWQWSKLEGTFNDFGVTGNEIHVAHIEFMKLHQRIVLRNHKLLACSLAGFNRRLTNEGDKPIDGILGMDVIQGSVEYINVKNRFLKLAPLEGSNNRALPEK